MFRLGLLLIACSLGLTTSCRCRCARPPRRGTRAWVAAAVPARTEAVRPADAPRVSGAEIYERLRSLRVENLRWEDVPFEQVRAQLQAWAGAEVQTSPQAAGAIAAAGGDMYVAMDNVCLVDVLDVVAHEIGLAWTVRDGRVRIEVGEEARSRLTLRYYDVNDLVDFVPFGTEAVVPAPARTPLTQSEVLEVTIRTLIEPASWADESRTLTAKRGVLIVRAEPATHEQIVRYLDALRTAVR